MKYFVCSDIHGFFTEWLTALDKSGFDIENSNHMCIICGDLFDRGREPGKIIEYIKKYRNKFVLIRGNHEDLMEQMIKRNRSDFIDLSNGTSQTIVDLYPDWLVHEFDLQKIANITGLQEILDSMMDYYETEHYIFVHGWIPIVENCLYYDENWRNARKNRWEEARWQNPLEMYKYQLFEPGKTIVCGHWHCSAFWHYYDDKKYTEFGDNAKFDSFITKEMIALDACTAYSNFVNVCIIED